jgi:hypothetical protein
MRRVDIPEDDLRRLVSELPFHAIAERYQCDARTVSALASRLGLTSAFVPRPGTDAEDAQIAAWTRDGWSIKRIARALGRSQVFVARRVRGQALVGRTGRPRRIGWPQPDTTAAAALGGRRYEDVSPDVVNREWPPQRRPLNGDVLASVGRFSSRSTTRTCADLCADWA